MIIQSHNPICVTPVQPHLEGRKSGNPHDSGFAQMLSQRQPDPKAPEAAREQRAAQLAVAPTHPQPQTPAPAHETSREKSHEKPRNGSARGSEANSCNEVKAPAEDSLNAASPSGAAAAKPRGHARAAARGSDARGVAASATPDAQTGPGADTAADVNTLRSAAQAPQAESSDPAMAQWQATLQLPNVPAPTPPTASVALATPVPPMPGVGTSEPNPSVAGPTVSVTSRAPERSPAVSAASVGTDAGVGQAPSMQGAAESNAQRNAAGAGVASAERDDASASAQDAGTLQLSVQTSGQATAQAAALLAPAATHAPSQSVDGIGAPATMTAAQFAPGPQPLHPIASALAVSLPTPVTSPDFQQALGVQVSVLARDGVQHAELQLNPADMGPVSVRIALDGTLARVEFGADTAATRHAIETGLPELASALRDAGLTLSGGGVSQHSRGRGDASQANAHGQPSSARQPESNAGEAAARPIRRTVHAGGVDLYA